MKVAVSLAVCLLGLPAVALAQYAEPAEHSIIRQTGFGWRNQVTVADGCGCTTVRADCYDQPCCFRCGLRPLCFLRRVGRMLDCLLPCNKCCCGPLGGCLLGGRCGGCCGPSCSAGCGCSTGLPGFSDPFLDDALVPPKPIADPGTEVRFQPPPIRRLEPAPRTASQPRLSPYKIAAPPQARPVEHHARHAPRQLPPIARQPAAATMRFSEQVEQSVLRRTSAEEPAPFEVEARSVRPIIRSQTPDDGADYAIPHNPLRGR